MTQNADKSKVFWATTADQAADQIYDSIINKKEIYIFLGVWWFPLARGHP